MPMTLCCRPMLHKFLRTARPTRIHESQFALLIASPRSLACFHRHTPPRPLVLAINKCDRMPRLNEHDLRYFRSRFALRHPNELIGLHGVSAHTGAGLAELLQPRHSQLRHQAGADGEAGAVKRVGRFGAVLVGDRAARQRAGAAEDALVVEQQSHGLIAVE